MDLQVSTGFELTLAHDFQLGDRSIAYFEWQATTICDFDFVLHRSFNDNYFSIISVWTALRIYGFRNLLFLGFPMWIFLSVATFWTVWVICRPTCRNFCIQKQHVCSIDSEHFQKKNKTLIKNRAFWKIKYQFFIFQIIKNPEIRKLCFQVY